MSRTCGVRRAGVGLLLLSLVLAGCGGGGSDGDNASSDEPSTTVAEARDDDELEADRELAESLVLTLADLGPGWTEEEDDGSGDDDEIGEEFDKCAGTSPRSDDEKAEAESPDFARGEGTTTGARVIVSATEADAKKGLAVLKRQKTVSCMGDALLETFEKSGAEGGDAAGATFDGFEFERVDSPEAGDESVVLSGKVDISAEGDELSVFFDYVLVREERIVSVLFATSFGEPFDRDELQELADIMADKMEGKQPTPLGAGSGSNASGRETGSGGSRGETGDSASGGTRFSGTAASP